jgi:hypothetical protein
MPVVGRMAERGRLACERPDGLVDVFGARWGGSDAVLARAVAGPPRNVFSAADWHISRRGSTRQTVLDEFDYLSTAALYWLGSDGASVALPLWFGLPGFERADTGLGALVGVRSLADARRVRRFWRALKGAVADDLLAGRLAPASAPVVLCGAVRDRECAFPAGLRSMVPSDVPSLL